MRYLNLYVAGTNGLFTYCDQDDEYEVGMFVEVKFNKKDAIAVVVEEERKEKFDYKINPILKRYPIDLQYDSNYIKLLKWTKNYYITGYSQIFNIGMRKKEKAYGRPYYILNREEKFETELDKKLLKYFGKKEKIAKVFLEKKFTREEVEKLLLEKKFYIIRESLIKEREVNILNDEFSENSEVISLNDEQETIKNIILEENRKYFLLKGVTGSGKTEVYISLIKEGLKDGKGTLFLVPEIALTPQIVARFFKEFGSAVAVLHSRMTPDEIIEQWRQVSIGEKKVVLGVRSAIFAPIKNIGFIIIDEEHENTYKQDSSPMYNAKTVALKRVEIEGCKLILGSATPSIESYYYGEKNVFKLLEMNKRYNDAQMPEIEIVDMKNEESQYFSKVLLEKIKDRLLKKEQIILFLNRKGYSTYIQCNDCGAVEECEHCSIKYSYYLKDRVLKCNYCGISKRFTGKCSKCGSENISQSGVGVEKIQEGLDNIFGVSSVVVDSEVSKGKDFHTNLYEDFLGGKYSIMIGTQMIAKGLHFPNVTLVGVINADASLNFPDFRSNERTFQLITQVAGRAGRGDKSGEVIIQTYQPENKVYFDIKNGDYLNFYKREIEDRKIFGYPPFSKIINIGVSALKEEGLTQFAKDIVEKIKSENVEIYGPMKSLVYKVKDRYRINIVIKGDRVSVEEVKRKLSVHLAELAKNKRFRVVVDVDPINLI